VVPIGFQKHIGLTWGLNKSLGSVCLKDIEISDIKGNKKSREVVCGEREESCVYTVHVNDICKESARGLESRGNRERIMLCCELTS